MGVTKVTRTEAEWLMAILAEMRADMAEMKTALNDKMDALLIKTSKVRSLSRKLGGQVDPVEPDLIEPDQTHIGQPANPCQLESNVELAPCVESHHSVPDESVEPNPILSEPSGAPIVEPVTNVATSSGPSPEPID